MPKLIIEQPGVPSMTVDLSDGVDGEVNFGRAEDNKIVLVAEEVSRYHAKIRVDSEKTILADLKSLNGTYVNRQRIVERILSDKDEIWFGGKCRAIFNEDSLEVLENRKKTKIEPVSEKLQGNLEHIREEMDRVSASMTMIGQKVAAKVEDPKTPDKSSDIEVLQMSRAFRRLDALYKASSLMSEDFDIDKRMSDLLDLAMEVMNAGRGFLMIREEGTENLTVKVVRGMGSETNSGSPSQGIARRAAIDGEPVLMADSSADQQFGMRESIIRQKIQSAVCVPLRVEDRIIGSLYVDSSQDGVQFSEEDLELFQAFANQATMALENVRLYDQMIEAEKKKASLGRFLSPSVVEHIMNNEEELELGGQSRLVTTMFCDIRGFTNMSEKMSPEALVNLLNDHFTAMTDIVFKHEGTLDKYNGDEVMALFGAPMATENDAKCAVLAAIDMQKKITEMNVQRGEAGLPTFDVGIGINTGDVIAGYIGSPVRMDFTVMGDHVNVASRFCSLAKAGQVVIGEHTYELVKDSVGAASIGSHSLKGKKDQVPAYELTDV